MIPPATTRSPDGVRSPAECYVTILDRLTDLGGRAAARHVRA